MAFLPEQCDRRSRWIQLKIGVVTHTLITLDGNWYGNGFVQLGLVHCEIRKKYALFIDLTSFPALLSWISVQFIDLCMWSISSISAVNKNKWMENTIFIFIVGERLHFVAGKSFKWHKLCNQISTRKKSKIYWSIQCQFLFIEIVTVNHICSFVIKNQRQFLLPPLTWWNISFSSSSLIVLSSAITVFGWVMTAF